MEILEKAQKMLEKYPLCDNCLGRQFALLGYELSNQQRGEAIKLLLTMKGHQLTSPKNNGVSLLKTMAVNGSFGIAEAILKKIKIKVREKRDCYLCEGQFKILNDLTGNSIKKLDSYEYNSFLVGIRLPVEVDEREDEFKAKFGVVYGESIRSEFSREIGKRIFEITKKEVNHKEPDIVIILNPFATSLFVQVNPVFIAGRYRKLVRGIPQSKWLCRECEGNGCPICNWTGKMYQESIEEIIVEPILEVTLGEDTVFHASGREDVDVRMLGNGRPFVVEVKKPSKRLINLLSLTEVINKKAIGKLQVLNLRLVHKNAVARLKKGESAEKIYKAVIEFENEVSDEEINTLEKTLKNIIIRQKTPLRVLHRRSDRVREKYIYETKTKRLTSNCIEMRIHCQGGLYIKELITGDQGRTDPSVAKIIKSKATPLELDVQSVIMKETRK